jgi:hypothetical protein
MLVNYLLAQRLRQQTERVLHWRQEEKSNQRRWGTANLVEARKAGLVEKLDGHALIHVLGDDALSGLVRVEGVHERQRNVDSVGAVQVLPGP